MRRNIALTSVLLSAVGFELSAQEWQVGNFNLLTDFVYFERYHVKDRSLALNSSHEGCHDGCFSNRVLDTNDLVHGYKPGMHISFSYLPDVKSAYELGGLYVWAMDNSETRTRHKGVLSVPFKDQSFASDFSDTDQLTARYRSLFYTGELNYWRTFSCSRHTFLSLLGVVGIRFAHIDEKFSLSTHKGSHHSSYDISAGNNLIGVQVGFDFQIHPTRRFYWELLAKAGVDFNRIKAQSFLGNSNDDLTLRNYARQTAEAGVFTEAAVGAGCQLLDWLNFHVGYQMLFFGGLAMAPNQISYSSRHNESGYRLSSFDVSTSGYLLVHGIYAGATFSF
jgi:hypothetical protein